MKWRKILFGISLLFPISAHAEVDVYFTPSLDCENKIIKLINNSSKIDIAVYAINNKEIVTAIKNAKKRKAEIRILTDRLQASNKSSAVKHLHKNGLNIKVHSKYRIEHNKFAIFNDQTVVTGSYNWTNPASHHNSENCVFISDEKTAVEKYQNRFNHLWQINSSDKSLAWFSKQPLAF